MGKIMIVGLINPPAEYLVRQRLQAPLGLLYLAAVAKQRGDMPWVLDMAKHDEEIPEARLYGITATTPDITSAEHVLGRLRRERPGCIVVLGGPHITSMFRDANGGEEFSPDPFDCAVVGEGEQAFDELLEDIEEERELRGVYTALGLADIDKLPEPARDVLMGPLGGPVFLGDQQYVGGPSTVISGSRGCRYACAFCASHTLWGCLRLRSPESVVGEMENCRKQWGIRKFRFSDETFSVDRGWTERLCGLLRGRGFFWRASVRADCIDTELCKIMRESGCMEISIGIESGDDRVLTLLRKGITAEQNIAAIWAASNAGMMVRVLLMAGCPGERRDSVEHTIEMLDQSPYQTASLTTFMPLPGTAVWRHPDRFGCEILSQDFADYNVCGWHSDGPANYKPVIRLETESAEEMVQNFETLQLYLIGRRKLNKG